MLDKQTKRNAIRHGNSPEKVLLHTAYTPGLASFDGPHGCKISSSIRRPPAGVSEQIKNSQGMVIQDGGAYISTRLPTEPLAIARESIFSSWREKIADLASPSDFVQRDLEDCRAKIGAVDDPNAVHAKGRGIVVCDEAYLPSAEEVASSEFGADPNNRFLLRLPPDGTVVEDLRMKNWASRATKAILQRWTKPSSSKSWSEREINALRRKVNILTFD